MRVSLLAWEVSWNRISTINQLKRRGWNVSNRCYLCKEKEETSDHLILFCQKATMLWSLIFSILGVQWVLHSLIKRNLFGWRGAFVGKRREQAWRAAPLCLMWTLWKERNERVFNDTRRSNQALKHSFLYTLVNQARVFIEDHTLSMIDSIEWSQYKVIILLGISLEE